MNQTLNPDGTVNIRATKDDGTPGVLVAVYHPQTVVITCIRNGQSAVIDVEKLRSRYEAKAGETSK